MKQTAIAFDFDGTLVAGGWDKGVHIMYAAWTACAEKGLAHILHPGELDLDVDRMVKAYMNYPGSPRFQQLSAVVNALASGATCSVDDPAQIALGPGGPAAYEQVRLMYNDVYSELNRIAAERYWRPFPAAKATLAVLAGDHDLYVASGVIEEILQRDVDHHGFDRSLFVAVTGAHRGGGADKAELLERIKSRGYSGVLFVGDSVKDLEYARQAGVNFYRIKDNSSYGRLLERLKAGLPNEPQPWEYAGERIAFYYAKTRKILQAYAAGEPMSLAAISAWINE